MKKNIVILVFSPRTNGNCASIGQFIQGHFQNSNVRSYVINKVFTPCGNCNYECLTPNDYCPSLNRGQTEVFDAIVGSDLVYYIVPNFCGMPNSLYYVFNERSVGYFNMDRALMSKYLSVKKQFIIVSNTENNTFVKAMQQQTSGVPEILYMKTSKFGKKSTAGNLLDSEQAQADLMLFLA